MKMIPEHFERLKREIEIVAKTPVGQEILASKYSAKHIRWELFHESTAGYFYYHNGYNDNHIDTALRTIVFAICIAVADKEYCERMLPELIEGSD